MNIKVRISHLTMRLKPTGSFENEVQSFQIRGCVCIAFKKEIKRRSKRSNCNGIRCSVITKTRRRRKRKRKRKRTNTPNTKK